MRKVIRYFFVGGCAALVDLVFFITFSTYLGLNYILVGATGFILATLVNYALSIRMVFQSGSRFTKRTEIVTVYGISLLGLLLHSGVLFYAVDHLGLSGITGKLLATALVFFWNFAARNYYVFRKAN